MKVFRAIGFILICIAIISYANHIYGINPNYSNLQVFDTYWPFFLFSAIFFILLEEHKERKRKQKSTVRAFDFPNKELRDEVYKFISELQIPEEEFHYKWFPSSNNQRNATMHIETNKQFDAAKIKNKFLTLSFVEKTFKVQVINLPSYCEYKYQIYIHFKQKEK